ncbi:MAG: aldo/keto reductase [Clostridia bacterium]|nr:aldo/keto reductase [Clostridia bacterium]
MAAEKGASVSQVCLAWLFKQPLETFPIVAPTNAEHIADNVSALDLELSDSECEWLQKD